MTSLIVSQETQTDASLFQVVADRRQFQLDHFPHGVGEIVIEADPGGECLVPILDSEEGGPSLRERDRGGELPPIVEDTGERTGLLGFAVASAQTSSRRSDRSAWPGGQALAR